MWWLVAFGALYYTVHSLRKSKEIGGIPFLYQECLASAPVAAWARFISMFLWGASFLFLILAFVYAIVGDGPLQHFFQKSLQNSLPLKNSRVVSFVVDRSGSMGEEMPGDKANSKMYIVQRDMRKCITDLDAQGGGGDLISLMGFARVAQVIVPFSTERTLLFSALSSLTPETRTSLNGTAIGYAIFKNVRLILACKLFAAQSGLKDAFAGRSIIVITDGIEEPNPEDRGHPFRSMRVLQALENAAEAKVSVYYINIDRNSYKLMSAEEREGLVAAVSDTGGKYFEVSQGASLNQILQEIVVKEAQKILVPREASISLGYWLIIFAMVATSLSRLFETAIMRVAR